MPATPPAATGNIATSPGQASNTQVLAQQYRGNTFLLLAHELCMTILERK
jgi:uncharacterized membrane protein AbrB (regulator of aidB expression)